MWHFPGLWEGTFEIMCRVLGYFLSGYSPRLQQFIIRMSVNSCWPMLKQWTWLAVWTLHMNIFSHTKCFHTRTSKNEWISRTGSGVELIRISHAQEISSLAPTCVQSYVPGNGGTGNKLVAGFPFWPSKQSLATLFCKVKASVLLSAIRFPSLLHVIQ